MVAFGFGEVFGGLLHGLLIDKIGSKKTVFVNILIVTLTFASTLYSTYKAEYNAWSFLMCYCWGYLDGSNNIFIFQVLGNEFDNEQETEAFGIFNLL